MSFNIKRNLPFQEQPQSSQLILKPVHPTMLSNWNESHQQEMTLFLQSRSIVVPCIHLQTDMPKSSPICLMHSRLKMSWLRCPNERLPSLDCWKNIGALICPKLRGPSSSTTLVASLLMIPDFQSAHGKICHKTVSLPLQSPLGFQIMRVPTTKLKQQRNKTWKLSVRNVQPVLLAPIILRDSPKANIGRGVGLLLPENVIPAILEKHLNGGEVQMGRGRCVTHVACIMPN